MIFKIATMCIYILAETDGHLNFFEFLSQTPRQNPHPVGGLPHVVLYGGNGAYSNFEISGENEAKVWTTIQL